MALWNTWDNCSEKWIIVRQKWHQLHPKISKLRDHDTCMLLFKKIAYSYACIHSEIYFWICIVDSWSDERRKIWLVSLDFPVYHSLMIENPHCEVLFADRLRSLDVTNTACCLFCGLQIECFLCVLHAILFVLCDLMSNKFFFNVTLCQTKFYFRNSFSKIYGFFMAADICTGYRGKVVFFLYK